MKAGHPTILKAARRLKSAIADLDRLLPLRWATDAGPIEVACRGLVERMQPSSVDLLVRCLQRRLEASSRIADDQVLAAEEEPAETLARATRRGHDLLLEIGLLRRVIVQQARVLDIRGRVLEDIYIRSGDSHRSQIATALNTTGRGYEEFVGLVCSECARKIKPGEPVYCNARGEVSPVEKEVAL